MSVTAGPIEIDRRFRRARNTSPSINCQMTNAAKTPSARQPE
jgi:hypothetical protein